MASSSLTLDQIYYYFKEKGGVVRNRDVVRHFKEYLTDPQSKEDARVKFKKYVNMLAQIKMENDEKVLVLKTKYMHTTEPPASPRNSILLSPVNDARYPVSNILSPTSSMSDFNSPLGSPSISPRQPPPYRPPPPVASNSVDNLSISSMTSYDDTPQAPPRRRSSDKLRCPLDESTPKKSSNSIDSGIGDDKSQTVSVKERTQKFNRLASVEDELSPRQPKSAEKTKMAKGSDQDDGVSVTSIDQKKKVEWYVTASKGDLIELLKLAKSEPGLVKKKDPFTAYTVLHWGAKHGNADIIKTFAGKYKVDVNGRTNGGYTPLHISAQFGHKTVYNLLVDVYQADITIRDYSGRTAAYYLDKDKREGNTNVRKIKGRKKQSEKDLGFLRIGSLNVRVKKTTEAFSNFLGVGGGGISPLTDSSDKVHKGWGSADNVNEDESMGAPKAYVPKKKVKKPQDSTGNSNPGTPKQLVKTMHPKHLMNDSDSDTAAGFDSNWKN